MLHQINQNFKAHIQLFKQAESTLTPIIAASIRTLTDCFRSGGKVLICGNGGSAADAQHMAAEWVGRFERERPGLAAIALTTDTSAITAIANDYQFERIFARQIEALATPNDLLIALSTSGNSANVVRAIETAKQFNMRIIALSGNDGGALPALLTADDLLLVVPTDNTARIQEMHQFIYHCFCAGVDALLFEDTE